MNDRETLHLTLTPIVVITLFLSILVALGFIWDSIRNKQNLDNLIDQAEKIYNSHQPEFIRLAKEGNFPGSIAVLDSINTPEKGVNKVYVLRRSQNNWYLLLCCQYTYNKPADTLNSVLVSDSDILQGLNHSRSFAASRKMFFDSWPFTANNFYALVPITEDSQILGVVLVLRQKNQD